jgi:hypothetical protein
MSPDVICGSRLRFGKFGGALLAVTSFLVGCDDTNNPGGGDAGGDAGTGFVSADPRGDGGANGIDTQDLSVGIETVESQDNLSVGLESLPDAGVTETSAPATPSTATTTGGVDTSSPPADASVAPADSSVPSIDTSVAPVDTSVAPVETLVVPVDTSAPPVDTSIPAADTSAPVVDTSAPVVDTSAPVVDTSAPVDTSVAPLDTSAPAPETSAPSETSSPAETSAPVVETSAPSETTEAPITSAAPDASTAGETSAPGPIWEATLAAEATWIDLPATFRAVNLPAVNLTFAWSVRSIPTGSAISDASLSGATASQVTFVPDVAGFYTLTVVVSAGDATTTLEATVQVSNVDVGYLEITSGPDGGYVHEPKMVPSDQTTDPFVVGCPYDTWEWAQRDYSLWTDVLLNESSAIGFRYPNAPGEETLFAYRYRYEEGREWSDATQVATVKSDCGSERPTDLQVGYSPDFSPPGKDLARIGRGDSAYLLSSPIDVNQVVYPTASSPTSSDWLDEASVVWSGYVSNGNFGGPAVAVSSIAEEGSWTILNCSFADSRFESIDEVAVVAGGLIVLSDYQLWYVPVLNDENGNLYAPCEYFYDGHVQIAGNVADFEVAPDRKTLALITMIYPEQSEEPRVVLGVGPTDMPFEVEGGAWRAHDLGNPFSYYTGLHWIADSQQLVWTEVQYTESDGYTFINDSIIGKINADGTYRRTLVHNAQVRYPQNIVTTGVVDLPYYDPGNF